MLYYAQHGSKRYMESKLVKSGYEKRAVANMLQFYLYAVDNANSDK